MHHSDAKNNMAPLTSCIIMARITVDVPDADLMQIDAEAKQQNVSRSKWAATAIDAYLHQKCSISDADVMQLKDQVMQLQGQLDAKTQEFDAQSHKITNLNDALDRTKDQMKQENLDATRRWEELKGVRNNNEKLKKDLDNAQIAIQRLQSDLLKRQTEVDQIATFREELASAKTDRERLQEAIRVREDDVAWLRGHVAQLTQQLALPPSQEEIRKKGWWQFWRRD
jgi:chromosome segregation ATPase